MGSLLTVQLSGVPAQTTGLAWAAAAILLALTAGVLFYRNRRAARRHRRVEADLRLALRELREMFDADLVGSFIARPDGSIESCNEAFARIAGYASVKAALDAGLRPLLERSNAPAAELLERLTTTGRIEGEEITLDRDDGSTAHALLYVHGIRRDGAVVRFYGRCLDLTAQKQLDERVRNAQKMEAVGLLAGGVAHDFNNVLTTIQGHAELLLEEVHPDAPIRDDLVEIRHSAERAGRLTRKLLAFSRRRVLRPRTVHLSTLVAGATGLFRQLLGEDVELELRLEDEPSAIRADPGEIEQLITNLVLNAGEALPDGGRVDIRVQSVTVPGLPGAEDRLEPGEYVVLQVTDDGPGMDDHVRARVFEPFFTTRPAPEGRGLGLATVYGIVRDAGGAVWVQSVPGDGATFTACFPRLAEPATRGGEPGEPDPVRHVVLAEDEEGVRRLVRRVLETEGYQVHEAGDGREALELALGLDRPVGLLVTDVVMPNLAGTELADRLLASNRSLRVLFMSGYTEADQLRDEALGPGQSFLAKPFSPAALREAVRDLTIQPTPAQGASR